VEAEAFSRWFLAIFFVAVALFYTVSIRLKTRRTGVSPVTFGRFPARHWLIHTTFRVFRALILLVCLIRLPYPQIDRFLVPIERLWMPALLLTGNGVMLASFAGLIWLHRSMGSHWRSGIPAGDAEPLITTGAYAISRNPMFLLIQLAQIGFFLSLPSVFTLVCLGVGMAAIHAQAGLEERHLAAHHGEAYRRYREKTPRWLIRRRRN
jgi:protein-S-isoprenylcysteine O-methyltransferase Ste14